MIQSNKKTKCLRLHAVHTHACTNTHVKIKVATRFLTVLALRSRAAVPSPRPWVTQCLVWHMEDRDDDAVMVSILVTPRAGAAVNSPSWAQASSHPQLSTRHVSGPIKDFPESVCHLPAEYLAATPSEAEDSPKWALPTFLTRKIMRYHCTVVDVSH